TANPFQPASGQNDDAFVAKLNAAGSSLVFSTYLGGGDIDKGLSIAVDGAGNACITGLTNSVNFPTANPLQPSFGGDVVDVFVPKFNARGSALVFSPYLGGAGRDLGNGIAVDSTGNVYVTGTTISNNFPTANPLQPTNRGADAFVTKLNASGS